MNVYQIAKAAHDINRAYCQAIGDNSQPAWDDAPDWQKKSAVTGVEFHIDNPGAHPADSHDNWMREKISDGWVWGEVKCPDMLEHPCLVPYNDLPQKQKAKDYIFRQVVHSLYHNQRVSLDAPKPECR